MASIERITIVVVTYNSMNEIGGALTALRVAHGDGHLACIVVDNASADGTADLVRREHPWATLIESGVNLGYGRGCNLGLERAETEYVAFMNPDLTIEWEALGRMLHFLDGHPKAGLAAPAIIQSDGVVQEAGGLPTPWHAMAHAAAPRFHSRNRKTMTPGGAPFQTDWLCGAFLVGRTDFIKTLGGFDPRFFLYFEETDLCKRALRAGWELWAVCDAVAVHGAGASARTANKEMHIGCISEHFFRSRYYYFRKHYGRAQAIAAEIGEVALLGLRSVAKRALGRPDGVFAARLRAPIMQLPRSL